MKTLRTKDELHSTNHSIKAKFIFLFWKLTLKLMPTTLKRGQNHKMNFGVLMLVILHRNLLKIIRECLNFNVKTENFNLCLNETLEMAYYTQNNLLYKRTELQIKCCLKANLRYWVFHTKD